MSSERVDPRAIVLSHQFSSLLELPVIAYCNFRLDGGRGISQPLHGLGLSRSRLPRLLPNDITVGPYVSLRRYLILYGSTLYGAREP